MKVAIIQPWLPQYREQFYDQLKSTLASDGIQLDIYVGETPHEWRARKDTVDRPDLATRLETSFHRIGQQQLIRRRISREQLEAYDLIVLEQAVRNVETYQILWWYRQRVAFWGHGRTYTKAVSRPQEALKQWLTRRAVWFFGYTPTSVEDVTSRGFPASRTTVVGNTIDTATLKHELADILPEEVSLFRQHHKLNGPTLLALGGIDDTKRIDFLLEAADEIVRQVPDAHLIFAGGGDRRREVAAARNSRPWLIDLGPTFGRDKALLLKSSDLIINPGRVGLVAVDSFAAGVPIVTTEWPFHAPEFGYLRNSDNAVITSDNVPAFASATVSLLRDKVSRLRLSARCKDDGLLLTMDRMVDNFASGIVAALAVAR